MKTALLLLLVASPALADSVWLVSYGDKKISVIKEVRTATGLGLKEAKDLVEAAPSVVKTGLPRAEADRLAVVLEAVGAKVEVRADGAVAPAAPAPPAPPPPPEGTYSVRLESFGTAKIPCIKVVREQLGLGLADAKNLVEAAPVTVKQGLDKATAEKLVKALNDVGGSARASLAGK